MKSKETPWTATWWGLLVLVILVLLIMFVFGFIYQYLDLVRQSRDSFIRQSVEQLGSLQQTTAGTGGAVSGIQPAIATTDDPYKGTVDAPIVIVEFGDFQCPFCRRAYPDLARLVANYPADVKLIYRDFPIQQAHPQAFQAALAGECAAEQHAFWLYHDQLFELQNEASIGRLKQLAGELRLDTARFDDCLDSEKYKNEVLNDFEDGVALGVMGTPTFFINGQKVAGVIPYETLERLVTTFKAER